MTEDKPRVTLEWSLWCDRHLKPYQAQWPKGAAVAMMRLFDAAVAMPAVADAAGHDADRLTGALQRFRPLCCFVGQDAMDAIYDETVPAPPGRNNG